MLKTGTEFLDSFARLGVFSKVQALMDDETEAESSVIKSPTDSDVAATPTATTSQPSTSSSSLTPADESNTKSMYFWKCFGRFLNNFNQNLIDFNEFFNLKRWRSCWGRKRDSARQSLSLAWLEHLPWTWLFIRVVWFSRIGTVKRFERLVPFHTRWKIGDNVLERQPRKWQR